MATGIDLSIEGYALRNTGGYTADEESTPVDVTDTTGATNRLSVPIARGDVIATKRMRGKELVLRDGSRGVVTGRVRSSSGTLGGSTLTIDSALNQFNVERQAAPFQGTLGGYLAYLVDLCGVSIPHSVDESLASRPIVARGWKSNVWFELKQLLPLHHAEVTEASGVIVFRPVRERVTFNRRTVSEDWGVEVGTLARSIEGKYYLNDYRANSIAFPVGGWQEGVQVFTVDFRETVEYEVGVDASLVSLQQPVAVDFVSSTHVSSSVYCVMGQDGLPIPAQQWVDAGGSLKVEIAEDTSSLIVTIVGADLERYAPFRIAATAGKSDYYSSLRVVGTGVFWNERTISLPTAADPDFATQEVGATIENVNISTLDELYDAMIWALARYGSFRQTLRVVTGDINRRGDTGNYAFPTIADFNQQMIAADVDSIAEFNSLYAGMTIAQFNQQQQALTASAFVNQAFGNVAGARRLLDHVWYRIRTAQISPGQISYTAESDTTVGDFNAVWSPTDTLATFNAQWEGRSIADFNVAPLEKTS